VALSQDGTVIAVGGWDGRVRLFSARSGKALGVLGYHRDSVQCLAFPTLVLDMIPPEDEADEAAGEGDSARKGDEESVEGADRDVMASTIELGAESDSDDDGDRAGGGGERDRWFASGGKDRRIALWELMDFKQSS
jgi:hypothetical protein